MNEPLNRRILLVDDTESIHVDFRKILTAATPNVAASDARAAFFGSAGAGPAAPIETYEVESVHQGPQALESVTRAVEVGRPFALAFVDVRMPPGWDGVETIERLWKVDPDLQVVVCSAYADYTWAQMVARLGRTDRLLFLKKPFDPVEVSQFACALTEKWSGMLRERERMEETRRAEQEARAYAASLKTMNRALETAKARAEASARAKSEFLANMSQEIRAPMIGILDHADLLRTPGLPRHDHEGHLETIRANGERLLGILEGILDMARIETGRLEIEQRGCSPTAIVDEVVARFGGEAAGKGLALTVRREGPLPGSIRSDPDRLRQIVSVLVGNAVEFTDSGSVEIALAMEETAPGEDPRLRIVVTDTGIGLTPEVRSRLFEAFSPGEPSTARRRRGAGLGLALSKRLAQMLGGDLIAEGGPRQGSRFHLVVAAIEPPLPDAPDEPRAPLPSPPAARTGRPARSEGASGR